MSKPVNKATTEAGTVDGNVVRHSIESGSGANEKFASSLELAMALQESQEVAKQKDAEIAALRAQLSEKDKKSASDDAISKLAELLSGLAAKPVQSGPTESETINKTTDFTTQRATIDGRSLLEAQAAVSSFRREPKVPISIPKALANTFGPYLAVSVNGVRIAVNCDGRTYMVNKTHAEHIKERIAKVDIYNAKPGEEITINA